MNARLVRKTLILSVAVGALALGGCGGGGGGARPAPTPTSAPPPPPPPPPPPLPPLPTLPTGTNYNDAEYARSNGATSANALVAHNAGGRGQGVKIAVIDSGLNAALPDFAGRVDPASRDLVANRGVSDSEGHGTAVTAVAAAGRNGSQILGVAFESTILSFNSSDPNDCTDEDGCLHSELDIAQGIDLARTNGARVINVSLGGDPPGSTFLAAVNRATAAGIVIVMSAGNDSAAEPDGFALVSAERRQWPPHNRRRARCGRPARQLLE